MLQVEPLLIFDLDGTILSKNSFPVWAGAMLGVRRCGLGLRQRLALSLAVQRLLLSRKLGRLDHDALLRQLQALWRDAIAKPGATLAADVQRRLGRLVRPNLVPVLRLVAEDAMDGILATAAAADYADPLGRQLGFSMIVATPTDRAAGEPHNAGVQKRDRVMALLGERDWLERPRIFFNDDLADLPLMQACHAVCWFGSNRDMKQAKAQSPGARFVACRKMRPNEMSAMTAHLGQSLAAAQLAKMPWVFPAARPRASTLS
ncbi:MAG TPA: haloacid dehalogenase-like hydrolase [Acetobacteraceae bacterium]|nr:haloacid dehalogenase-like hydrolase [Acetobacteraceae bacterium]